MDLPGPRFGFLLNQLVRRGVHKSVQTLEKDVRLWIATWNGLIACLVCTWPSKHKLPSPRESPHGKFEKNGDWSCSLGECRYRVIKVIRVDNLKIRVLGILAQMT